MELLTVREVAQLLRVNRRTVERWLQHRRLAGIRLPGGWRVRRDVLEAFLQTRTTQARSAARPDAETHAWLTAELGGPLPPYEWGEVEPDHLGEPLRYVPGQGWVTAEDADHGDAS